MRHFHLLRRSLNTLRHPQKALALGALLSTTAVAEPPIVAPLIVDSFPGEVDGDGIIVAPRNVRPLMFTRDVSGPWLMTVDGVTTEVLASELASQQTAVFALSPGVLDAGVLVDFEAAGQLRSFAISDDVDETPPLGFAGELGATFAAGFGANELNIVGLEFEACLPTVDDEDVAVLVTGEGFDGQLVAGSSAICGDDDGRGILLLIDDATPRRGCWEAVAVDAAGNESAPYAFCVDLENQDAEGPVSAFVERFGCAATPTTSMWCLVAGLVGLTLRRQRRSVSRRRHH